MKVTKSQLRKLISEAMEDSSTQMSIARLGEQIKSLELAAKRIEEEIPFQRASLFLVTIYSLPLWDKSVVIFPLVSSPRLPLRALEFFMASIPVGVVIW